MNLTFDYKNISGLIVYIIEILYNFRYINHKSYYHNRSQGI